MRSGPCPVTARGAIDRARLHEALAQRERLVEERLHLGGGHVDALLVALEAQHLVGVDRAAAARRGRPARGAQTRTADRLTACRRARATSAMRRMCSGPEPQQPPTMLQPASSSAG